jgi:alkanesulfonate monooxygenase SsuD/methylene tetrahydromethanopterin reductase-like flavin-dependent oxidoreductase (luciferase family)
MSLADATGVAAIAEAVGVTALRFADGSAAGTALDPTVVAAYLAGRHGGLGYVVDVPTTHHAPYNVARRILSLDRATAGRAGLVLRPGGGDEVSDAATPDPTAVDPAERWAEYTGIVTRLWGSFPRNALLGDQDAGLFVEDSLVSPIDHDGRFYRVRGPLDGPSSVQGRPVLVAADVDAVGWDRVASVADIVVVGREQVAGADAALAAALAGVGRRRGEVTLLGRAELAVTDPGAGQVLASQLRSWAADQRLDGIELAVAGDAFAVTAALRAVIPHLGGRTGPTLRAALGSPVASAVPA